MKNVKKIFKRENFLSSRLKKGLLMSFITVHLLIIFTVCVYSSFDSYLSFYKEDDKDFKYPKALIATRDALTINGMYQYTSIAGIDAGYGFFAPNVASEYILEFALRDNKNNLFKRTILPDFRSKESIQQYSAMLGIFQDKLKYFSDSSKTNSLYMRYLDVIIKSMAHVILRRNKNIDNVTATLYLYNYPSLHDFRDGNENAQLLKIVQFKIH